jgi:hypothetical protein
VTVTLRMGLGAEQRRGKGVKSPADVDKVSSCITAASHSRLSKLKLTMLNC